MNITDSKYIAVTYKLYVIEDGNKEMIEEATKEQPFHFISELGTTLPAFETAVKDLEPGAPFTININKEDAYGDFEEENVIELPKSIFEVDGRFDQDHIYPGNIIPLMNNEGQTLNGTVVEVQKDIVIVDMNHPLAGSDISFVGEVVENRVATNQEIQGMINMLTGEESGGCGCGAGGCGDEDCGSGCASGSCGPDCGCGA